jgi:ArsR family transcriptional regulator
VLVLHHLPDPGKVIAEASRALRPGGRLLVMDMLPHDREDYRQTMGHVWLGFSARQMGRLLSGAGFERVRWHALPSDPGAKGPGVFAAVARRAVTAPTTALTAESASAGDTILAQELAVTNRA